jgi:cytokinin dehydrogenase
VGNNNLLICRSDLHCQVRWIRALYSNFTEFTADQERLISLQHGGRRFDYVEGFVVAAEGLINNWRSSFFSPQNPVKLSSLKHHSGVLYCLEVTKNYDDSTAVTVDQVRVRRAGAIARPAPSFLIHQ